MFQLLDLILTSFTLSLFCCGLYAIAEPGKLLHFLHHPFTRIYNLREVARIEIATRREMISITRGARFEQLPGAFTRGFTRLKVRYSVLSFMYWIYSPIIGCVTCMASIWGFTGYTMLYGLQWTVIPACIITAFFNEFLYSRLR